MPMPFAYRSATEDYEKFLDDLQRITMLQTWHQAYQTLRAVLIVFRNHVPPQVTINFAQSLPVVLRAILIEDWDLAAEVTPFPNRTALQREVECIRPDHNISPATAIGDVALVLRRAMKPEDYSRMLANLPEAARPFWEVH
jgi:uncharacterized protein (DUF2267 family)